MNGLGFIHPLLAAAAAMVAIPVIIHLIHRRRSVPHKFAAIRFVLLSNRRTARAFKIKQLLLLLMRMLIFLLLPLAVARMVLLPETVVDAGAGQQPSSVGIIVDNSYSMGYLSGEQTLFSRGRKEAESVIQRLRSSDDAFIIPLIPAFDQPQTPPVLSYDKQGMLTGLDAIDLSQTWRPMEEAVGRAWQVLASSPKQRRRIIIISDFAVNGWNSAGNLFEGPVTPPAVELVDVRKDEAWGNLTVAGMEALRDYATGSRHYRISVTVQNHAPESARQVKISVALDGTAIANGFVDIAAQGEETKVFTVKISEAGEHLLEARLEPDHLPLDDRRSMMLSVPPVIRVLMVDGSPSTTFYKDEVFYLRNALDPQGIGMSGISIDDVTPDRLLRPRFDQYDVVIMANVPTLPDAAVSALKEFVRKGGGLIITAGDAMQIDFYNQRLLDLLPGELRTPKAPGGAEAGNVARVTLGLGPVDYNNPLFSVFNDETAKALYGARFTTYLPFNPDVRKHKTILLRYTNDQPALVEYRVGEGRALLLTSSVDRDWSDLCIRTAFLPLMQESVHMLARSSRMSSPPPRYAGASFGISLPPDSDRVRLTNARGEAVNVTVQKNADDENTLVKTDALGQTGVYELSASTLEQPLRLVINPDPAEGNCKPLAKDEALAYFSTDKASTALFAGTNGLIREFALYLAWAVLLAFFVENYLIHSLLHPAWRRRRNGGTGDTAPGEGA